ncbi:SMI1/KNR4 family protein [Kitasatospora sp. NPDC048296]|uniref:SMI1/KNR4 family protein n=1 Tax=Kitasatospora sp. NPDC048296 TaxID=3364048 RepID=UPI00371A06B7
MIEQAARRIAEGVVAKAPEGWTEAVLSSQVDRRSASLAGRITVPGATGHCPRPDASFEDLRRLGDAVRQLRGWDGTALELRCRRSGEHELLAFEDSVSRLNGVRGGFHAVLDGDYRLPQPGADQEAGTAAPVGDPALAVARFRTYLERRAEIRSRPDQLPPPAPESAIEEVERRIGHRLPADLRALYRIADGDAVGHDPCHLIGTYGWLSLESMVAVRERLRTPFWYSWELGWDWVVFDADPPNTVRRCGGHPAWLPFATGEDGNYLAVDLAPARDGRPGQVIRIGADCRDGPEYVAESVTALIGRYLEQLESASYEYDVEEGWIELDDTEEWAGQRQFIGEIPDPVSPTLQALYLHDLAGVVDLSPLTAATQLRRLYVGRSAVADLSPLRGLPVESLRVPLEGGDLSPLEGHPTLRSLELATVASVDLAVLRTLPNLHGLDVADATVGDLTVLADLPGLRYLALNRHQWTELLAADNVPSTLAAAGLMDPEATMSEALAWAARLGHDTSGAIRLRFS